MSTQCAEPAGVATQPRGPDRRHRPYLLSDWRFAFGGRRRGARRADDGAVHVDWYPASMLLCALTIFVLSGMDAILTLHLMERGVVEEANPFMARLIRHDVGLFVGAKTMVTAVGVVALVIYGRLRLFNAVPIQRLGWYLVGFYSLLVGYEVLLLEFAAG